MRLTAIQSLDQPWKRRRKIQQKRTTNHSFISHHHMPNDLCHLNSVHFCSKMPPIFPSPWWDASPLPPLYLHALSGSPEKPRGRVWANRVCTFVTTCMYVGMYVCIPLTILWNPLKLTGERSIERVKLLFKYKEITRPKKPHLVLINICHSELHKKLPCYANACPLSWHWNKATRKQCLLLQQVSQDLNEKKNSK